MNILLLSPDYNSNDRSALKITNPSTEVCENEVINNEVIEKILLQYICFSALLNLILDSQLVSEMRHNHSSYYGILVEIMVTMVNFW